jgi:hypothetical protein
MKASKHTFVYSNSFANLPNAPAIIDEPIKMYIIVNTRLVFVSSNYGKIRNLHVAQVQHLTGAQKPTEKPTCRVKKNDVDHCHPFINR